MTIRASEFLADVWDGFCFVAAPLLVALVVIVVSAAVAGVFAVILGICTVVGVSIGLGWAVWDAIRSNREPGP